MSRPGTEEAPALKSPLRTALACKCPRCGEGGLYKPDFLSLSLNERCAVCGLELAKNDNGDGPAVFLIFVIGFSLVPLAFIAEHFFNVPNGIIIAVFAVAALTITIGGLRPLKAYVMALQYKHRPEIWKRD
jgi:uncharacterized protein (DUF983 family)